MTDLNYYNSNKVGKKEFLYFAGITMFLFTNLLNITLWSREYNGLQSECFTIFYEFIKYYVLIICLIKIIYYSRYSINETVLLSLIWFILLSCYYQAIYNKLNHI